MKQLTLILLLTSSTFLIGQNLVPNPSFEDTVACPLTGNLVNYATGWSNYSNQSPDYYNACSTTYMGVPQNWAGFQYASHGQAYCAISTFYPNTPSNRELIGTTLTTPLNIGTKYYVTFDVSLSLDSTLSSNYACNKIGALFTTAQHSTSNPAPISNFAHVYTNSIVTDTLGWTQVSGSFVADSAYTNIALGNFFDDNNTDTLNMIGSIPNTIWSYYFIDNICVSTDSLDCPFAVGIKEVTLEDNVIIYPNPTQDRITISIKADSKASKVTIYNMHGQEVLTENIKPSSGEIQLSLAHVPPALYLVHLLSDSGSIIASQRVLKN